MQNNEGQDEGQEQNEPQGGHKGNNCETLEKKKKKEIKIFRKWQNNKIAKMAQVSLKNSLELG